MPKIKKQLRIFMSWHGQMGEKIATTLRDLLRATFPDLLYVFMSDTDTDYGEAWFAKITKELKTCDTGIVCVTSEGTVAPWLNFESGAISIRGKVFFPILFGAEIPQGHPLGNLKYLTFCRPDIARLISSINSMVNGIATPTEKNDSSVRLTQEELLGTFQDTHWPSFKVRIEDILSDFEKSPPMLEGVNCAASKLITDHNIDIHRTTIAHGIVAAIPIDKVHKVRRDMVGTATDSLTIVGSSLYEAFSTDPDLTPHGRGSRDISRIISEILKRRDDTARYSLSVFLSEPRDFDVEHYTENDDAVLTGDSPLWRISSTMTSLLKLAKRYPKRLKLSICFIPLLQVDHIVQSGDLMIVRPTMLWTSDSQYKGTWLLCQRVVSGDDSTATYNAYSKWLDLLRNESFQIPLDTTLTQEKPRKATRVDRFHRKWREAVDDANRNGCQIEIRKLYRTQLISAAHATWGDEYRHYFPEIHASSSDEIFRARRSDSNPAASARGVQERSDLFNEKNLLGDGVQTALLGHLLKTQDLLDKLIKIYDKDGFAQIYPSFDLGLPNNVQRIAGGFATGMLVLWRCGTPIIPIDTTVNACSSSFYSLTEEQFEDLRGKFARREDYFDKLVIEANKASVLNSFSSGNHFIILGKSRDAQRFCLVLHASATEFKYKPLGLYPYPGVWYWNKIKVFPSRDGDNRYIRYLKDREAERFIHMAVDLADSNKEDHNWFARRLVDDSTSFRDDKSAPETHFTKHHYYMPTSYSVAMGTYVENPGTIVPIFSRPGRPIYLFRSSVEQPWTLRLANTEKCLIPHGWGQALESDTLSIAIENTEKEKSLILNGEPFKIAPRESLSERSSLGVKVRDFRGDDGGMSEFLSRGSNYFAGSIVDTFDQVACYQRGEITIFGK